MGFNVNLSLIHGVAIIRALDKMEPLRFEENSSGQIRGSKTTLKAEAGFGPKTSWIYRNYIQTLRKQGSDFNKVQADFN